MVSFISETGARFCQKHSVFQLDDLARGINKYTVSKMWLACPNTTDCQVTSTFLSTNKKQNITLIPGPFMKVVFPEVGGCYFHSRPYSPTSWDWASLRRA